MTPRLQLIARQMERREQQQAPAPEVPSGIGGAIEAMISQAVEERVAAALAEQRRQIEASRPAAPTYTSFEQIPPSPRTRAPKPLEATIQRDGAGLARSVTINGRRFIAQRDAAGQLVRMVSEDKASEVSYNGQPVPSAKANKGA